SPPSFVISCEGSPDAFAVVQVPLRASVRKIAGTEAAIWRPPHHTLTRPDPPTLLKGAESHANPLRFAGPRLRTADHLTIAGGTRAGRRASGQAHRAARQSQLRGARPGDS